MSGTTLTRPAGFVRPRFDDGTFDEPLPLEDHVLERVVHASTPARLVVEGPRGSGLTTTIRWLAGRIAAAGARVLGPGRIDGSGGEACRALDRGEAVLLLDLSVGRLDPAAWTNAEALLMDACQRRWRAVAVAPALPGRWGGLPLQVVQLAPWTRDDLIDALGAPNLVARRAALLAAARALPDADALLARPRTALWVLEAAAALGPDEPVTLARVYANVLDTLSPSTLAVLRRLGPTGAPTTRALAEALEALPADQEVDEAQLSALFEASGDVAPCLIGPRSADLLRRLAEVAEALGVYTSRLALPGLHHMLQAGECLDAIARDDDPPLEVAPAWFPFLRELVAVPVRARLRAWLTEAVHPERARDGVAATILWVTGEVPPLDGSRRPPWLAHAWLEGLDLPGADLAHAFVGQTRLRGARLQGARLTQASLVDVDLTGAALAGADLEHARLQRVSLVDADLRGASGEHVALAACDLRGASLEGARLDRATLGACRLGGASLRRAVLRHARLLACPVDEADLVQVDLEGAELSELDLSRAACFEPASLRQALLSRCALSALDLSGVIADSARLVGCELSGTRLAGASLVEVALVQCRAHEAVFDDADLRGAVFEGVRFQAGSSRSGLLVGKPALEGSMTGFYVEGTTDDAWAAPESLRQASFRGADLRGATFAATNLFRVDLRGARLERDLREQAREQGALLDDR